MINAAASADQIPLISNANPSELETEEASRSINASITKMASPKVSITRQKDRATATGRRTSWTRPNTAEAASSDK